MQAALKIASTVFTPEINFDPKQDIFSVIGRSYPENVAEFYKPVFEWLKIFLNESKHIKQNIHVYFEVDYLNSTTLKLYYELAKQFKDFNEDAEFARITWTWKLESSMDENMIENIKTIKSASNFEIEVQFEDEAES